MGFFQKLFFGEHDIKMEKKNLNKITGSLCLRCKKSRVIMTDAPPEPPYYEFMCPECGFKVMEAPR